MPLTAWLANVPTTAPADGGRREQADLRPADSCPSRLNRTGCERGCRDDGKRGRGGGVDVFAEDIDEQRDREHGAAAAHGSEREPEGKPQRYGGDHRGQARAGSSCSTGQPWRFQSGTPPSTT